MSYPTMFVRCPACGEDHPCDEKWKAIDTLDIEEDIQGRDMLTYVCLATGVTAKSYVIRKR